MNRKSETQKFWNRNPCGGNWNSIDALISWRNVTEPYMQKILRKVIEPGKKVLDIGCGQGLELIQNLERNVDIIGMDYSKDSLKKTRTNLDQKVKQWEFKGRECILIEGDAENLPLKSSHFDVVYSIGVLHHTPNTKRGINEIYRVLKSDGTAVVMMYHKFSWRSPPIAATRFISKIIDKIARKDRLIYNTLIKRYPKNVDNVKGTAMLELFGCPILKMYTKKQMRSMFNKFSSIKIECYSSNLFQLSYLLPVGPLSKFLMKLDKKLDKVLGFHLVAICRK